MQTEGPENSTRAARLRRWLGSWPATLLGVVLIWAAVSAWQARAVPKALPANWQGPALGAQARPGGALHPWLEATRGQARLLYVWASWCGICAASQDKTGELLKDYPVQTVAMQSGDAAAVDRYMKQHRLNWPVWVDEQGSLARQLGVGAVPAYLIIGPDNTVRYSSFGYTPGWTVRFRLWLASW